MPTDPDHEQTPDHEADNQGVSAPDPAEGADEGPTPGSPGG
ncbi:hypothetical protein [uncultured Sphingomonas sp.]